MREDEHVFSLWRAAERACALGQDGAGYRRFAKTLLAQRERRSRIHAPEGHAVRMMTVGMRVPRSHRRLRRARLP